MGILPKWLAIYFNEENTQINHGEQDVRPSNPDGPLTRIRTLVLYTNPPALAGGC